MEFSHDDAHLLTVSRDRQFCILAKINDKGKKSEEGEKDKLSSSPYQVVTKRDKEHARILWGCSWSHDDVLFATASRDKTVKVKLSSLNNMKENYKLTIFRYGEGEWMHA